MTTAGVFKEKVLPPGSRPATTTSGPDGAIYVTLSGTGKIAKWSRSTTGAVTLYDAPTPSSRPFGIAVGADSNIYATEWYGNKIARMPLGGGAITETSLPTTAATPNKITLGSDGRLYFSEQAAGAIGVYEP
jgi:virginiamycin B lyase